MNRQMNVRQLQRKKREETTKRLEKKKRWLNTVKPYFIGAFLAFGVSSLISFYMFPFALLTLGLYAAFPFAIFLDESLLKFQNKYLKRH